MFCKNCGTQMPDDAAFCPKCGTAMREGKQTAKQPEGSGETGKGAAEKIPQEVSKPRKPAKKADKRKVLIGAGAGIGIGIVCVIILLLSAFKSDFLYQYNDDGTARLVEYNGNGSSVTIPSEVKHGLKTYSVTSIGHLAFNECSSLTSITIPDSVTSIDGGAFNKCSSLTSITIPDSVTRLNSHAFIECYSLTSITIAGVNVTVSDIGSGRWQDMVGKIPENPDGYNRSDFVSEKAYQNYLDFGDTSGLKK